MTMARHEPFASLARQRSADRLGMAVFLASEAMLFGALIVALLALHLFDKSAFVAASQRLSLLAGTANTAVLLTSSLLVALGVEAASNLRPRAARALLFGAAALGLVFLAIKGGEYGLDAREGLLPGVGPAQHFPTPGARMFMDAYLVATGLHAVHVIVGVGALLITGWRLGTDAPPPSATVANIGLYWHLVDIVWVFLFPILYLAR